MKILFITTISNTVNAFLIPHIEKLISEGHSVEVAFNIVQEVKQELYVLGCKVNEIPFSRSPLKSDNFLAYRKLKKLVIKEKYDMIHTHTPVASMIVRLVCRNIKNIKVIYTAHGFHFYKGAQIFNWLVYYPIEKILSRYTDIIITINHEDNDLAKRKFKARKIIYVPGVGIDVDRITETKINRYEVRKNLGLNDNNFALLSIGELNKNKNHETIIRAIVKIDNPDVHYLICGEGELEQYLKDLTKELGLVKQIHFLGFRKDIPEICKASDLFLFPSLREGLGLAALEAMASELAIVTSNVHGIVDYSINGITGFSCNPTDINGYVESIQKLINNPELRHEMGKKNRELVKKYDISIITNEMWEIYKEVLNK
jgi:glycosyltransferase involved in cell wall biosynthesis